MSTSPLNPENRVAFTDVFRPPAGYRLAAGIGTTYTLEFETFTALLLGFAGAEVPDPTTDVATALTVLARLKNQLRVFVNAGGLGASKSEAAQLFALYDTVLRPVSIPGAAFHPKVWVLRFDPHVRPESAAVESIYRFVCGSRNVTSSTCWELALCLEGTAGATNAFSADLAAFLKKLPKSRKDTPPAVWRLIEELPGVEFRQPSEAREALRFLGQWPGASLQKRLPEKINHAFVMSPFVRGAFLKTLIDRTADLTIVSTQEELDALPPMVHEQLAEAELFIVTGGDGMDTPGLDLHAKLFVLETAAGSETFLGSANATAAAWAQGCSGNCEAMVSLTPGLSVRDTRRAFVDGEKKGELRGWIARYTRQPVDEEEREAEADFRAAQMAVSASQIAGVYDERSASLTLRVEEGQQLKALPVDVTIDVAPFLPPGERCWKPHTNLLGKGVVFDRVPPAHVSAFVTVRMRRHESVREFVLQYALQIDSDAASHREQAITAAILEGADLRQILLNVLQDLPAGSGATRHSLGSPGEAGASLMQALSIERVIEACTADPGKIDEIDAVLKAAHSTPEIAEFNAFWIEFRAALAEASRV